MSTATDRRIFHFHDGERDRVGDPLAIRRRFLDGLPPGEDVDPLLSQAVGPLPEAGPALDKVLPAIRSAFQVKELDDEGHGLTQLETLRLLADFFAWNAAVEGDDDEPESDGPPSVDSPAAPSPAVAAPAVA